MCKGCLSVGTEHSQTRFSAQRRLYYPEGTNGRGSGGVGGVSAAAAGVSAELVFKGKREKEVCAWMS